jgi:hypothetical protein
VLQSRLSVASAAALPVGGSVALEASPLRLGVPHHDQELSQTTTDFIHAVRLERGQVKAFKVSVVRQSLYPDLQGNSLCTNTIHNRLTAEAISYSF